MQRVFSVSSVMSWLELRGNSSELCPLRLPLYSPRIASRAPRSVAPMAAHQCCELCYLCQLINSELEFGRNCPHCVGDWMCEGCWLEYFQDDWQESEEHSEAEILGGANLDADHDDGTPTAAPGSADVLEDFTSSSSSSSELEGGADAGGLRPRSRSRSRR